MRDPDHLPRQLMTSSFRPHLFWLIAVILFGTAWSGCSHDPVRMLVFSHTEGFRHGHIPLAREVVQGLGTEMGMVIDTTENPADFNEENLARYDAVLFLSTTGDVFDRPQEVAFRRFIQRGGGYLGIHAASDTEYDWPWYGQLVGAYFSGHPAPQEATLDILDATHPTVDHLPQRWERFDEWYSFRFVNPDIIPLISIDETTYDVGNDTSEEDSHPMVWYHDFDGGRSYYIQPGHTDASWSEPAFLELVRSAMTWVTQSGSQKKPVSQTPYEWEFKVDVLTTNLNEPMELEALPDGRIMFIERPGAVHVFDPSTGFDSIVNEIPVAYGLEDGLLGMALDPDFEQNGWVYLYHSPLNESLNRISRFTFDGSRLDLASEVAVLDVGTQRETCCHAGGSLEFGPEGSLFLSVGDNTNPFEASGSAPIDERSGRSPYDAQGTSANSQDLRGKILRIRPEPDGSYSIPDGNLFSDPSIGRPEIYVMGNRNPFRISIDSESGWLYWGDIGPDASEPSESRGPQGYDELNQARSAGFFGWPYFIADNKAYRDWDFEADRGKDWFDAGAPVNDSPNSSGTVVLPPAQPAFLFYPYGTTQDHPLLGDGGRSAMAGSIFRESVMGEHSFPSYFEGKLLMYEWMRHKTFFVTMDQDGHYRFMEEFLPSRKWSRPMDMTFGSDGALYVIEYGEAWNTRNEDATLTRIEYRR